MLYIRFLLPLFVACLLVPAVSGETQVGTTRQFEWPVDCGKLVVTLKVFADLDGAPGLYRWDYTVYNDGIETISYFDQPVGISYLQLYFPQTIPEIANLTGTLADPPVAVEETLSFGNSTVLYVFPADPAGYSGTLVSGSSLRFSFTTYPRPVTEMSSCEWDESGDLSAACGYGQQAPIFYEMAPQSRAGRRSALRGRALPGVTLRGGLGARLSARGRAVACSAAGCAMPTGPSAGPGALSVKLKEFYWSYKLGGNLLPYYQSGTDWSTNTLVQGDTGDSEARQITAQQQMWKDEDLDGVPEISNPALYLSGNAPAIKDIKLVSSGLSGQATLHVASNHASLVFPDASVEFLGGIAAFNYNLESTGSLPAAADNIDVELTWSISFAGGPSIPIATTTHKIWVVLGAPSSLNLNGCTRATAARIDWSTKWIRDAEDGNDPPSRTQSAVAENVGFGGDSIQDLYDNNPWAALDAQATEVDCVSLANIAASVLQSVGVFAEVSWAYPTRDGDASGPESNVVDNVSVLLDFFWADGVTINGFEGFFYLKENGTITAGYTVAPKSAVLYPYTGSVQNLPTDPLGQLKFSVMYNTLKTVRSNPEADPERGGQQWWVQPDSSGKTGTPVGNAAVPFAVPIP